MARARKTAAKRSSKPRAKKAAATSSPTQFKCPECRKTFARAAALGAHRRRAHGVAGVSTQARASAKRRNQSVNRDAMLQLLFPNGVPAREEVIRSVNGWLDEAERLARL